MDKLIVGCGYLGLRVARTWIAEGHSVWALTRSDSRAVHLAQQGIRPIVGDVCEPKSLAALPAAETVLFAVGYDRASGRSRQDVVVGGIRNLLNAIGLQLGRLIYISTTSVYGQADGEWVDESSECHPVQEGGQCGLAAEGAVHSFFDDSARISGRGSPANILRLSGIYGPGRLLTRVDSLRAGQILPGRPDAWLNLIHVDDAVAAIQACELRSQPGRTYLVTDNLPIVRADYYSLLARLSGAPPPRFDPRQAPGRGSGGLNKRCRNRRMVEELKATLRYPTINEGLPPSLAGESETVPFPAE